MPNSKGFVVKSIKNGETSMIVSCYLEDIGLKSFIVKVIYGTKKPGLMNGSASPLQTKTRAFKSEFGATGN